jgi:hypothetical protein
MWGRENVSPFARAADGVLKDPLPSNERPLSRSALTPIQQQQQPLQYKQQQQQQQQQQQPYQQQQTHPQQQYEHPESRQATLSPTFVLDFDSAIGFNTAIACPVQTMPDGQHFIYAAGCNVIINSIARPRENQRFLQGNDTVSCFTPSPSGSLIAVGQTGNQAPDILVWQLGSARGT